MNAPTAAARSTFVTVLGWTLLAFNALALLFAVGQGVWLATAAPQLIQSSPDMPPAAGELIFGIFRGVTVVNVVLAALLTYAAYAFLKRRNWARNTFLVLFAIALAGNVLAILFFGAFHGVAGLVVSEGASQLPPGAGSLIAGFLLFWIVAALAMAILLGWCIKRLRSAAVKAEFTSASATA